MTLDAIVLGLGGMGAAALHHLAARGASVLGLEQHSIAHARGSSHGLSRVIRKAYNEHPSYVPLLLRAYELWRELEQTTGSALLEITGAVHVGPAEHVGMRGVREAIHEHALDFEMLEADAVQARFPALVPREGDIGIVECDAGVLAVERGVAAHVAAAVALGADARTGAKVVSIKPAASGVEVECATGERHRAEQLVLCGGPWLAGDFLEDSLPLAVSRQVQLWFAPQAPRLVAPGLLPVFVHFVGNDSFYGIPPGATHAAVKVCRHYGGTTTTADTLDRDVHHSDVQLVRGYLRRSIPTLDGEPVRSSVCMYTNTPDHHFVVGRARQPNVLIAGGFSGHGFKFAPVIGEILADLVCDGQTQHDIGLFHPDRFGTG